MAATAEEDVKFWGADVGVPETWMTRLPPISDWRASWP